MTDRPTVDFDHYNPEFHKNRVNEWAEVRKCPVAFNERYGGFWAVTGYDEVAAVARDEDTFSSRREPEPVDGIQYVGIIGVPRVREVPQAGIAEAEESVHAALRRAINPFLVPAAINKMQPLMERCTTWFLDQKIESGEIDLVLDFANPVPAILTMELMGLPHDNWRHYADVFHASTAYGPDSPQFSAAMANVPSMVEELLREVALRRREPRNDLLTELVQLELGDGRTMDDDQLVSVLWNLVGGGLDTTTALTSLSLYHLDEHPELRQELIDHPELLPTATEEFLRFTSVSEALTRTVTRDVELGGQQLQRGEPMLISWLAANRDETKFPSADSVLLDRAPNPHLAFGVGTRRCIGMHMARTMFQILMTEVLTRIPDYKVDRSATAFYGVNPWLNGIVEMPATFTAGTRAGPTEKPF